MIERDPIHVEMTREPSTEGGLVEGAGMTDEIVVEMTREEPAPNDHEE